MKVFYSIDIQMIGAYEVTGAVLETASHLIGFEKKDIDELETYHVQASFGSNVLPSTMHDYVRSLLTALPEIFYVDVIFRFKYAMHPDRFVIWQDGKTQEYTGHITFTEDK